MQKDCRHAGIMDSGLALRAPRNDDAFATRPTPPLIPSPLVGEGREGVSRRHKNPFPRCIICTRVLLTTRTIPKSGVPVFGKDRAKRSTKILCFPLHDPEDHVQKRGKRSAERRIVQAMSAHRRQVYAVCATHLLARRAAPTAGETPPFGAHACGTRHRLSPRWLSSRTGFPAAAANGSFARFAQRCRG